MRKFGHQRPVRDNSGEITGFIDSPVTAVTRNVLGGNFGKDSKHRLVVSLEAGDLVCVRPTKTTRTYRVEAKDLFHWLLRCEANKVNLERAREKKAKKAQRLADARQRRAELRLRKGL